jgi:hypothetical protein
MFDGVKMPNPRVQAVVRAGKFLKTCLLEADEHRREHARAKPTGLSLEEILKQAGLHIPDVQAAIRNLLGDGVAVTAADDVLAAAQENPDLVKLARELLRLAERGHSGATAGSAAPKDTGEAKTGSSAPPSNASPDTPPSPVAVPATPPNPPPSPVAASVAPPNPPTSAAPPPANVAPVTTPRPKFRPEYTAQGRLAALQKTTGESSGVAQPDQRPGRVGDDAAALAVERCSERLTALEQAVERLSTRVDLSLGALHTRVERIEARLSATPAEPPGPVACPEPTSSPEPAATTADDAHARPDNCVVEPPPLVETGPSSEPIAAEPFAEPAEVSPAPEPVEVGQAPTPDESPSSTAANDPVSGAASGTVPLVEGVDVPELVGAEDQSNLGSVSESPAAKKPAAQSADDNDEAFALLGELEGQP